MATDYGFDEIDAYMLLSQAGRIRLRNIRPETHHGRVDFEKISGLMIFPQHRRGVPQ
jgi:hypothetical protein